jgi:hypothetical protein
MKLFSRFVVFFIVFFPGFLEARLKTPFENPQLTWFYQHVIDRSLDYSFVVHTPVITLPDRTSPERNDSYKGPLNVKGGGGFGFNIDVPHSRWFTFGFLLGIYAKSPSGTLGGIFTDVGGRLSTRIQFFSRLQAPFRFDFFSISPNLKLSLGVGGGIQGINGDNTEKQSTFLTAPVGIPIGLQGGIDFYFGKWVGLEIALQYLIEPGVDFMFPALVSKFMDPASAKPFSTMAKEWSLSFGIKSTYL